MSDAQPTPTYLTFISHRCQGEGLRAAERLVRFMRSFRLPRALQTKYPLSRTRLTPFFYSRDSLSVINLYEEMPLRLAESEFLIIVCTPDYAVCSPNSHRCYADIAVASFLGSKVSPEEPHGIPPEDIPTLVANADPERKKHIIPVICRSGKDEVTAEQCLSPLLKALDCIGPDMGVDGEERVFNAVAARLLGLDLEELYSRWQKRERRRRKMQQYLGGLIAASFACAAWWSWDYYIPHESYYADYTERAGIPQGIRPLTEKEARRRFFHYRFLSCKGKLREVSREDSYGNLFTAPVAGSVDKPSAMSLIYDESGRLISQIHTKEKGKPKTVLDFKNDLRFVTLKAEQGLMLVGDSVQVPVMGRPDALHGRGDAVAGYQRSYDAQQRLIREDFVNLAGERIHNESGAWGRAYRYNQDGRLISRCSLDSEGNIANERSGIAEQAYTYDKEGNIASVQYLDAEGKAVCREDGVSTLRLQWDKHGIICTEFLDTEGKPCLNDEHYHRQRMVFCEQNGMVQIRSLEDTEGKSVSQSGDAHYVQYAYDDKGRMCGVAYYNEQQRPGLNAMGYHAVVASYQDRSDGGYVYREFYINEKAEPCRPRFIRYASKINEYDSHGYLISQSYFDLSGKPCCLEGAARIEFERTPQGAAVRRTTYNEKNAPCMSANNMGVCTVRAELDGWGNVKEQRYYDENDTPCASPSGVARIRYLLNEANKIEAVEHYGVDGNLCDPTDGTASIATMEYKNRYGHRTALEYRDRNRQPFACKDGISRYEMKYNIHGEIEEIKQFEPDGAGGQRLLTSGPAYIRYAYDSHAQMTTETSSDKDGKLLSVRRYDGKGNPLPER